LVGRKKITPTINERIEFIQASQELLDLTGPYVLTAASKRTQKQQIFDHTNTFCISKNLAFFPNTCGDYLLIVNRAKKSDDTIPSTHTITSEIDTDEERHNSNSDINFQSSQEMGTSYSQPRISTGESLSFHKKDVQKRIQAQIQPYIDQELVFCQDGKIECPEMNVQEGDRYEGAFNRKRVSSKGDTDDFIPKDKFAQSREIPCWLDKVKNCIFTLMQIQNQGKTIP
jgi:hypothetical protein